VVKVNRNIFFLSIALLLSFSAANAVNYERGYVGPVYRQSTSYNTGYGYGWDNTYAGEGFMHHSSGFIETGPWKCIGNGCGYTYYLDDGHGWGNNQWYNSKTYPYHSRYYNPPICSGYWRDGCEHARYNYW
jgi:hypothetical protein